jgi:hypothetical protein
VHAGSNLVLEVCGTPAVSRYDRQFYLYSFFVDQWRDIVGLPEDAKRELRALEAALKAPFVSRQLDSHDGQTRAFQCGLHLPAPFIRELPLHFVNTHSC